MYDVKKIIENITHNALYSSKLSSNPSQIEANKGYKKGSIAVVSKKDNLAMNNGTKGFIAHSTEKIAEISGNSTHWTPNPYTFLKYTDETRKYISGHTRKAIKQISSFVFDIDDENLTIEDLKASIRDYMCSSNIPEPTMIVETPRGFHLYYSIDSPFFANKNTGFKAIKMAEKINSNLKKALSKYLPIDPSCVPFGFFRMPNKDNIKHYKEELIETKDLIKWSYDYSKANEPSKKTSKVINFNHRKQNGQTDDWVKELLQVKNVGSHTHAGRNSVIFTLGLYYYSKNKDFEWTYNKLDEFNSSLFNPLSVKEFDRVLNQAYSGDYSGVSREYAVNIIDTYLSETTKFTNSGFYKHKKERDERERSHNHERVQDIIDYLKEHTSESKPYIEGSVTELTECLSMSRSTFYDIVSKKQMNGIVIKKEGKGRSSKTKLYLKELFLNRLVRSVKKAVKNKQRQKTDFKRAILSVINESDDLNIIKEDKNLHKAFMKHIERLNIFDKEKEDINIIKSVYLL